MKPEIISLGRALSLHMIREDLLFNEIINCHPNEEESIFWRLVSLGEHQ
jgi:hypothetical protein